MLVFLRRDNYHFLMMHETWGNVFFMVTIEEFSKWQKNTKNNMKNNSNMVVLLIKLIEKWFQRS